MTTHQEDYWRKHFTDIYDKTDDWLDYADALSQAQTFALGLEAAGVVGRQRCLDAGCGKGRFSLCLAALGASEVVGIDQVEAGIRALRTAFPHVRWEAGSMLDASFCRSLGTFDHVFLLEVLQYVPPQQCLATLWGQVAPGGRLIGVVPNGENPFVRRTMSERYEGNYAPSSFDDLAGIIQALPEAQFWAIRGLMWRDDQRLTTHDALAWTQTPNWPSSPKRLMFAALRRGDSLGPNGRSPNRRLQAGSRWVRTASGCAVSGGRAASRLGG